MTQSKPVWTGAIVIGQFAVPATLYPATRRHRIAFRWLHAKDQSPITERRFCAAEGVEVDWEEIARGYEYAKGQFVTVSDVDLARARATGSLVMDVRHFVPRSAIGWLHFEDGYFIAPSRRGLQAYRVFHEALHRTGRAAVASLVLRQKQHLSAILPGPEGVLMAAVIRFADELREPDFVVPAGTVAPAEMELALRLIEAMSVDWRPAEYGDVYHRALRELLERKVAGELEEAGAAPERQLPPERPILEALQASLAAMPRKALAVSPPKRRRQPKSDERTA